MLAVRAAMSVVLCVSACCSYYGPVQQACDVVTLLYEVCRFKKFGASTETATAG